MATAVPDPCVASRTPTRDGGVTVVVLSSHASSWNFGFATAPVVSAGGPYTGDEGASFTLHGTASNAAGLAMTFSWDLGGGATATGATPTIAAGDGPATPTATLTVCETGGACASDKTTIHVDNVAPTAKILAPADGSVFARPDARRPQRLVHRSGRPRHPHGRVDRRRRDDSGDGRRARRLRHRGSDLDAVRRRALPVVADSDRQGRRDDDRLRRHARRVRPRGGLRVRRRLAHRPGRDLVLFEFEARYRDHDSDPSGHVELHVPHLTLFATHLDWLVVTSPSFVLQGHGRVLDHRAATASG